MSDRPFYARHADGYDLLIDDPAEPWVDAVCARIAPASSLLDAGCGTGRHAAEFRARGHRVELADAAPELLAIAVRRCPGARTRLVDLRTMVPAPEHDAVTCRGVLNDLLTDADRAAALATLTGSLRPGGRLFLDVREAGAARARADGTPRSRTVATGLTFTGTTTWDDGLLRVAETYTLAGETVHHDFTMRPWRLPELTDLLRANGFQHIEIGPGAGRRTPDRLFVMAAGLGAGSARRCGPEGI
ncbi:class I SAM-dependent methyltransferase [Actinoplanes sp. NPDC051494]|uniref:class I SAM-dependent methyltransferase n=1 Tax=Actinoplanes sp. NPDC051494 TaxID=3363907 RepID=UPI0037AA8C1E